jgi:hypothetical protein
VAEAGATVEEIRELAGHADMRTTMIYTAVNRDRLEHVIANSGRRRRAWAASSPSDVLGAEVLVAALRLRGALGGGDLA